MAIKQQFAKAPEWPEAPAAAGSQPGHNRPPVAIEAMAEFNEQLDQKDGIRKRIEELIGASERATATSAETLGKCGQTVVQIRTCMKVVADAHVTAKAPYLEAGRVIDAAKNDMHGRLSTAKKLIEDKQNAYLRAQKKADDERRAKQEMEETRVREQNERIQREYEEAVRKVEEEAESAAKEAVEQGKPVEEVYVAPVIAAPVYVAPVQPLREIERGITRGPEGAAISGKKVWKSEVTDYAKAFQIVQSNSKVRDAIDTAVAAVVRAGMHQIEGVRIWEDVGVSNR